MTDPIADMLTRIQNAMAAKLTRVDIPASKLKLEIARILKDEGYINNFVVKSKGLKRIIRIFLNYHQPRGISINQLARESVAGSQSASRMRKSTDPPVLYPIAPSTLGKEKIEAAVSLNILKMRARKHRAKTVSAAAG